MTWRVRYRRDGTETSATFEDVSAAAEFCAALDDQARLKTAENLVAGLLAAERARSTAALAQLRAAQQELEDNVERWHTRLALAIARTSEVLPGPENMPGDMPPRRPPAVAVERLTLPAEPLLRLVDSRGGARAAGVVPRSPEEKAIERARRTGFVSERAADELAVRVLGLTPAEVWGTKP